MKWRMTSTSLTSGKPSISARTLAAPSASAGSTAGTSSAGKLIAVLAGRTALEEQRFVLRDVLRTLLIMRTARPPADGIHIVALRHLGGAEQHASRPVPDRSGQRQAADDFLLRASAVLISSGVRPRGATNSLKNGPVKRGFSFAGQIVRFRQILRRPVRAAPACRRRVMKTVAISAISAWLVQMFEVAFSRRICCSRVASVRQKARLPWESVVSPDQAAGQLADELFLRRDDAGEGSAVARRDGERLQFAGDDIGVGGGSRMPSETASVNDEHQQRAALVRELGGGLHLLDDAEEVGRLNDDGGRLAVELALRDLRDRSAPVSAS